MSDPRISVLVQAEPFDPGAELNAFARGRPDVGAVTMFTGLVRDLNQGDAVARMFLEHYPGMTERALADIGAQALARWPLLAVRVIHRHGELLPSEPIVAVLCAATHRGETFAACEFIMDFLKTGAPIWKRESTPHGERWVDARASDEDAQARWDAASGPPGGRA